MICIWLNVGSGRSPQGERGETLLLAGGVVGIIGVALRQESEDRNTGIPYSAAIRRASLSARRAWIEICYLDNIEITQAVALRKESGDRNILATMIQTGFELSLSARRAWIEIC